MLPPQAFYLQFFSFLLVEVLVIGLLLMIYRLMGKYEELEKRHAQLRFEAEGKAEEIFAKAEQEAVGLIQDARTKAHKIIADAEGFSLSGTKKLQESLEWMLQDQTRTYTEELKQARQKTEEQLKNLAGEINQLAAEELKVFANNLRKQTEEARIEAQKSVEAAYEHMGEEVEKYKQVRLERVDDLVRDLVLNVARDVMGDSLTRVDHEALVLKAIAEAKQKQVF